MRFAKIESKKALILYEKKPPGQARSEMSVMDNAENGAHKVFRRGRDPCKLMSNSQCKDDCMRHHRSEFKRMVCKTTCDSFYPNKFPICHAKRPAAASPAKAQHEPIFDPEMEAVVAKISQCRITFAACGRQCSKSYNGRLNDLKECNDACLAAYLKC
jgi:hypothetical protein